MCAFNCIYSGMNFVAGFLIVVFGVNHEQWIFEALVTLVNVLTPDYFAPNLIGSIVDQASDQCLSPHHYLSSGQCLSPHYYLSSGQCLSPHHYLSVDSDQMLKYCQRNQRHLSDTVAQILWWQAVLSDLAAQHCPSLLAQLEVNSLDHVRCPHEEGCPAQVVHGGFATLSIQWLCTLFVGWLPPQSLLRVRGVGCCVEEVESSCRYGTCWYPMGDPCC